MVHRAESTREAARPAVLLLTESFPYHDDEDTFLPQEVGFLTERFNLVIAPCDVSTGPAFPMPPGVAVVTELAHRLGVRGLPAGSLLRALGQRRFWREVRRTGAWPWHARAFATVAVWTARALTVADWVGRWFAVQPTSQRPVAIYTWWANAAAVGALWADTGVPVVTRAHGADLYPEQSRVGFIAYQSTVIENCAAVLPDGQRGVAHLVTAYPEARPRVRVAYLGTPDPGFRTDLSADGRLRIVSCSGVVPVKRVEVILTALALLTSAADFSADSADDFAADSADDPADDPADDSAPAGPVVEWTHLGDGPGLPALRRLLRDAPALSARVRLLGRLPADGVIAYYREHPVDLFLNVSRSEGLPVAMLEAASCGIPLLGTDVGGIGEVIRPAGGLLLPGDLTSDDLAAVLAAALRDVAARPAAARAEMAQGARRVWQERFDAARVYPAFTADLAATVESWRHRQPHPAAGMHRGGPSGRHES